MRREQRVEAGLQTVAFWCGWCHPIGDQQVAMGRDDWGQFGIMARIVKPAQRVFVGQQLRDGRLIAQQAPDDRHGRLRVIGRNRQGVPGLLALQLAEARLGVVQLADQIGGQSVLASPAWWIAWASARQVVWWSRNQRASVPLPIAIPASWKNVRSAGWLTLAP